MANNDQQSVNLAPPGRLTHPSVTLMPSLRGARVIKGKNGGEQLFGELIAWYRIVFQSNQGTTSVLLRDADGRLLKIHNKSVRGGIKNRADAAERAQQRHILAWARSSDEPISFVPQEASVWGITILAAMMVPSFGYLYYRCFTQFQHFPPQSGADWFVVFQLTILTLAALFMGRFMFIYRPRKQRFESIDLLPSGFVGTLLTGEIMSVEFDEQSRPRFRRGDLLRLEFRSRDGHRMSFAVPKPVSTYLRAALNPPTESQAQRRRATSKRYFWLGIRIIVVGILCTIGSYFLIAWLGRQGWILPQDVVALQRRIPFLAGYPTIAGFLMIFLSWKYSDHGLRTRSRIARWFHQRKKHKDRAAPGARP